MEKRSIYFNGDFKTRDEPDGKKVIEGYFAVFNQKTELWRGFFEEIDPSAFDESLEKNDIRCLYNHDTNMILGRAGSKTLELHTDSYGLYGSVEINENDKQALDIYARVKRGDINGCSFGFNPIEEKFDWENDEMTICRIIKADVREISICPFPAYPQTVVQARMKDYDNFKIEERNKKIKSIKARLEVIKC